MSTDEDREWDAHWQQVEEDQDAHAENDEEEAEYEAPQSWFLPSREIGI